MARRVLLDENLPHALRKHLTHHEAQTAAFAGFAGLKNGQLLAAAESAGFEVLLTGTERFTWSKTSREGDWLWCLFPR